MVSLLNVDAASSERLTSAQTYPKTFTPEALQAILDSSPPVPIYTPTVKPDPVSAPQKPSLPPAPEVPWTPTSRIATLVTLGSLGVVEYLVLPHPLHWGVGALVGAYALYKTVVSYPKRQQIFVEKLEQFRSVEYPAWQAMVQTLEQEWQNSFNTWQAEEQARQATWQRIEEQRIADHCRECESCLTPETLLEWRFPQTQALVQGSVVNADPAPPATLLAFCFWIYLRRRLPGLQIDVLKSLEYQGKTYLLDLAIHDPESGIWINVEIDEPWSEKDGKRVPDHHKSVVSRDHFRDRQLLKAGWIVIRLAERQVIDNREGCLNLIASVIDQFNPHRRWQSMSASNSNLAEIFQWTEEEAVNMSRSGFSQEDWIGDLG